MSDNNAPFYPYGQPHSPVEPISEPTPTVAPTRAPQGVKKRSIQSALVSRLTGAWLESSSLNQDLISSLQKLRNRSRGESVNNAFLRRFLRLVKDNVVGPTGIGLSVQAKDFNGNLDKMANDLLESAWKDWSRDPTVHGNMSLAQAEQMVAETTARDGEVLIRFHRGRGLGLFGFKFEIIEADFLDELYNDINRGIKSGVEFRDNKPVAYHLWTSHPNESGYQRRERIRVPATDILHIFEKERPSQVRGFPWATPVMGDLHQLNKYIEAAVVSARVAAARSGMYTRTSGSDDFTGDDEADPDEFELNVEPGSFGIAPEGWSFSPIDWNQPNEKMPDFVKGMLRKVASGLGVSYHALSSDYEGTNYSSSRMERMTEQEMWRNRQVNLISRFLTPVWEQWLTMTLSLGLLNLPLTKFNKFNKPVFMPRVFQYIDPEKSLKAVRAALELKLTSRSRVAAEQGNDFEEILVEVAKEQELMKQYGVDPALVEQKLAAPPSPPPDKPELPEPE